MSTGVVKSFGNKAINIFPTRPFKCIIYMKSHTLVMNVLAKECIQMTHKGFSTTWAHTPVISNHAHIWSLCFDVKHIQDQTVEVNCQLHYNSLEQVYMYCKTLHIYSKITCLLPWQWSCFYSWVKGSPEKGSWHWSHSWMDRVRFSVTKMDFHLSF